MLTKRPPIRPVPRQRQRLRSFHFPVETGTRKVGRLEITGGRKGKTPTCFFSHLLVLHPFCHLCHLPREKRNFPLEKRSLEGADSSPPQAAPVANPVSKSFSAIASILVRQPQHAKTFELLAKLNDRQLWKVYHSSPVQNNPQRKHLIKAALFDRFVPDTLRIVHSYIKRNMPRYSLVDPGDIEQDCLREMYEYLDKYDPDPLGPGGGNTFMQYFNSGRLMGQIADTLRLLMNCHRDTADNRRRLKPFVKSTSEFLGRRPNQQEIIDHHPEAEQIFKDPMLFVGVFNQSVTALGSSEPIEQGLGMESHEEQDRIGKKEAATQRTFAEKQEAKHRILSVIENEEDRLAVYYYYWLGKNYAWIAERFLCSVSSAVNKCSRGRACIKRHFSSEDLKRFLRK